MGSSQHPLVEQALSALQPGDGERLRFDRAGLDTVVVGLLVRLTQDDLVEAVAGLVRLAFALYNDFESPRAADELMAVASLAAKAAEAKLGPRDDLALGLEASAGARAQAF